MATGPLSGLRVIELVDESGRFAGKVLAETGASVVQLAPTNVCKPLPANAVDAAAMVKAGLLRRAHDGVRLLGNGELKAKVAFSVWGASKSAVAAVEKAGGAVTILAPAREPRESAA